PCQTVVVTGVTNILERAEIHHTGSRCPNKSVNNFVPGDCGVPHNHSRVGNRHAHHGICSIPAQGTKVEPLPCLWAEERNSDWSGIAAGDVTSSHEDTRLVNAPSLSPGSTRVVAEIIELGSLSPRPLRAADEQQ